MAVSVHEVRKVRLCEVCGKWFYGSRALGVHRRRSHKPWTTGYYGGDDFDPPFLEVAA